MQLEHSSSVASNPLGHRTDLAIALSLTALAGFLRFAFVAAQRLPTFDPWRHLLLIQNVERGDGFTLFAGQPYLWYQPVWHPLVAWMPGSLDPTLWAAVLSTLAVPLFFALLRARAWGLSRPSAVLGGLLLALFAPVTAFTCHLGSEALALFLTLLGLTLPVLGRGRTQTLCIGLGGLSFGIGLLARLNFVFLVLLAPVVARSPRKLAIWSGGFLLPLALGWWRNHRILANHEWVFTWDGLAVPSRTFNFLSTFFLQMHPDIRQGLSRLHQMVRPQPDWVYDGDELRVGLIAFMVVAALAIAFCGRATVTAAGVATLVYLLVLDRTLSSHFFRVYLGLFPIVFLSFAILAESAAIGAERAQLARRRFLRWAIPLAIVAFVAVTGAPYWTPAPFGVVEDMTPPPPFLSGKTYFAVNSGYYQPESLMFRYPDVKFIGLPLHPDDFDDFRRAFPEFEFTLWQQFNVQEELLEDLRRREECRAPFGGRNLSGIRYQRIRCLAPSR